MNADGSNQTTLLSIPDSGSSCPNWSPCGDQIVFEADINGQGIFLMNSDGSGLRKLVSTSFGVNDPVWSPVPIDGKEWIAYMDLGLDSGEFSLFLADVDCDYPDNPACKIELQIPEYKTTYPTWSPDATRLAAIGWNRSGGPHELLILDLSDGVDQPFPWEAMDLPVQPDWFADWSKENDRWIALNAVDGLVIVDTLNTDINGVHNTYWILPEDIRGRMPSWSPFNTQLVYWDDGSGNRNLAQLAILDLEFGGDGVPTGSSRTVLPKEGKKSDSYTYPDWRRAPCPSN